VSAPEDRVPVRSRLTDLLLAAVALAAVGLALFFTWRRLFIGVDLQDESYSVLIPWRWALGDRPFLQEQNLQQVQGLLTYPFVKLFGVLRGYDVTGLVLYTRHLYLLLMLGVAVVAFLFLRRFIRWQLALPTAGAIVTYVYWATPQLTESTLALAFLTLSATLSAWVVFADGRRLLALASGACLGVACIAYPTLLFIVPFWAVLLAFAHGRRAAGIIADGALVHLPDPPGPPTGPVAWRVLSAWALGGALVLVPAGLVVLSFGPRNLARAWAATMAGAKVLHQLGGATKAFDVAQGFARFITWRPYVLLAALAVYLVYRRWPSAGRALLCLVPFALWLAAGQPQLWGAGYVIAYAVLAPYLYLFVPRERRMVGAQLLLCVWAPSVVAGAMTGYTSAAGYMSSAVGLAPAIVASGLFLCWALEAVGGEGMDERSAAAWTEDPQGGAPRGSRAGREGVAEGGRLVPPSTSWLPLVVMIAVLAVTVGLQFRFQQGDVPRGELTSRFDSGPWWGVSATPGRRLLMDTFAADLQAQARPGDSLLVFYGGSGYYLYWGDGDIVANSYSLPPQADGRLPRATVSYYRRHRIVPTLVVHLTPTAGMTDEELAAACGGLEYPPALVRPTYAFQRKPAEETTAEVLARLPRQ
jgi:hypothetical protein